MQAGPKLQPLELENVVNTSAAEFLGAITHTGTMTMKKPSKCPTREIVSIVGSVLAPKVLNTIVIARKANMISVYCQLGNRKVSFSTATRLCKQCQHTCSPAMRKFYCACWLPSWGQRSGDRCLHTRQIQQIQQAVFDVPELMLCTRIH